MAWTTPRTYTALEVQTAAIWNTHLRDQLLWIDSGGGTSSMAGWNAYTPTWASSGTAQPAIGNGTLAGSWARVGSKLVFEMRQTNGGTTTYGDGHYTWTLPATAVTSGAAEIRGFIVDTGTATYRVQGQAGGIENWEQYLNFPGSDSTRLNMPDDADSSPTGDIDLACLFAFDDWTPAANQDPVTKWPALGNWAYIFQLNPAGTLSLFWTADGSTALSAVSTAGTGFSNGTRNWIRVTMDVNNGSGSRVIKFYTAPVTSSTDFRPGTWTQLGSTVTAAGTTSIYNSTGSLTFGGQTDGGAERPVGKGYGLLLNNAYDTADLWASADIRLMVGQSAQSGLVGWPVQNTVGGDDSPSQKTWTVQVATALTPAATLNGASHPASTGLFRLYTGGTTMTAVGKVNPFTWANTDTIRVWGVAEV